MESKYFVIIPSLRRAESLHETVLSVLRQYPLPERIILTVTSEADTLPETRELPICDVIYSKPGLTGQLNAAIDKLPENIDMVTVLDDDVELSADYCSNAFCIFSEKQDVVLFDGNVLRDGGISRQEARLILEQSVEDRMFILRRGSYGCNMNVRRSLFNHLRFDPALVGGALMHDLDFARRAEKFGAVGRAKACRVVHLAVQTSRPSGVRYGFSQIANPYYFYKKGLISIYELLFFHCGRYFLANVIKIFRPSHVDRIGRIKGNLRAISLILTGRCNPKALEQL